MNAARPITAVAVVALILSMPTPALQGAQPQHKSAAPKTASPSFSIPHAKGFTVPQSAARPAAPRTQPSMPSVTRTQPKIVPSQPAHAAGPKTFEPKGWGHTTPTPSAGAGPSRPPMKPTWPATSDVVHPGTKGGTVTHPSNPAQPKPPVLIALPIPVTVPGPKRTSTTDHPTVLIDTTPARPVAPPSETTFSEVPSPLPVLPRSGAPRRHAIGANAIMAAQIPSWQQHTECLPFGGTPDVNRNNIPDYIYDTATGSIVINPQEPDSDNNGWADVLDVDADGNNKMDLSEWEGTVFANFNAAGINPFADDDGDGVQNVIDYFASDADGDGIVNLNDWTPCGDAPADPNGADGIAGGGNAGPPFFPIPMPVPMPGLPGGGLVGIGPQPGLPIAVNPAPAAIAAEQPIERSVLVASAGDVDADSDNSSPTQEPDHSVAEERAEDEGVGLVVHVSTADDRHRAPLDVKLPAAGAQMLVRFRDAGGHLALFTSDPVEHPEARRLEFDRDYPVSDLGFTADVFRRLYVESTAAGRDAVSVEIDVAGDGTWATVDGLVVTSQSAATDAIGGLSVKPAAARAQVQANQSFLLPAQGIGSEPGKVAITFGAATFECPVEKWTNSSLQARVAAVPLTAAADGTLVITLADGRVAASIPVRVAPAAEPAASTQAVLNR